MPNILYSRGSGLNDTMIGKIETPVRMLIESESDALEKETGVLKHLFNIEKSGGFGETTVAESGFDMFQAKEEGQGAENDSIQETYKKFISHITFAKEFTITEEMMEDAKMGIAAEGKRRARGFVQAYYRTRNSIAQNALIHGTEASMIFNKARVDLTTGDELPLFSNAHPFFKQDFAGKTQSNYFWGDISSDTAAFSKALTHASNKMRNVKDENGCSLGYTADYLLLPNNRPDLEEIAKRVCGTERSAGNDHNDINIQYGNWNIIVLPEWESEDDRFMIMSDRANRYLGANMFYNRSPLKVVDHVDTHTGNMIWTGRCRFGLGFTTWKHIALCVNSSTSVAGASKLR